MSYELHIWFSKYDRDEGNNEVFVFDTYEECIEQLEDFDYRYESSEIINSIGDVLYGVYFDEEGLCIKDYIKHKYYVNGKEK